MEPVTAGQMASSSSRAQKVLRFFLVRLAFAAHGHIQTSPLDGPPDSPGGHVNCNYACQ
jgi:hypothetical protein